MTQNSVNASLNPVQLRWEDGKLPISPLFNDSYYSAPHNGLDGRAETSAVFLKGNSLPERWRKQESFHLAELGFGTGLNFTETAFQWLQTSLPHTQLHYTSFEQYPLSRTQMLEALSPWPVLHSLSTKLFITSSVNSLTTDLQDLQPAIKTIIYQQDNKTITLNLIIGDANKTLPLWLETNALTINAWYLDGFSPAKNPELWKPDLMLGVFKATAKGGTFSTYTSAGHVRRSLAESGFNVEKVDGFGRKRHRLQGQRPLSD